MKIAILNDTHCGIRNSSDYFIDYQSRFYNEVFFPYCKSHEIKQILHLGDMFDNRRYINFKALNSFRHSFLTPLKELSIKIEAIPGNHDVFYRSTNELSSMKELLGYFTEEIHLNMKPALLDYGHCKIGLLPWINDNNMEESIDFIKNTDMDILGAHLELKDFEIISGIISKSGMDRSLFKHIPMVLSGHYHIKSTMDNIHYLGSQMQYTWNDCDNKKYFHVLDTETKTIEAIHNPIEIYQKIYYSESEPSAHNKAVKLAKNKFVKLVIQDKIDDKKYRNFISRLEKMKPYDYKIISAPMIVEDSNIRIGQIENTIDLINEYVDNSGLAPNENKHVKKLLHELYMVATTNKEWE